MFAQGETVALLKPGVRVDKHGDQVPDPANPVETLVNNVAVNRARQPEFQQDARNSVVSGSTLYFLDVVDQITAYDQIRVRGRVERVDGEPAIYRNPYSGESRMVVQTKRYDG